jgi:hypothetical protein
MREKIRFGKAAVFSISTEEIYYSIMEFALYFDKYLFLVEDGKWLADSQIR